MNLTNGSRRTLASIAVIPFRMDTLSESLMRPVEK
jgi:hypothetical protein